MEAEAPGLIFTIVVFLAAITVLVFVHEMGHFLVARWCKVKVDVFSIGFGKEIWGRYDKYGTRWRVSAIPLGGYVKFFGDSSGASTADKGALDTMSDADKVVSFHHQKLWKRAAIVFAGPFVNFLFAIIIFAGLAYDNGGRVITTEIGAMDTAMVEAGLEVGDVVLSIEGRSVERFDELLEVASLYPKQPIELVVDRFGETLDLTVLTGTRMVTDRFDKEHALGTLAIAPAAKEAMVGQIVNGSAAQEFGLQFDDKILAIDGINISSFAELRDHITPKANQNTLLTIERDDDIIDVDLVVGARKVTSDNGDVTHEGVLGIYPSYGEAVDFSIIGSVGEGVRQTNRTVKTMATGIGQLVLGLRSIRDMSGPIGIAPMVADFASHGFPSFLAILALLSINLGFVNLLPIPLLDGGHLMFYGIEAVKGGPLPERAQNLAFMVGFAFVIGLMLFLTLNDLHSIVL